MVQRVLVIEDDDGARTALGCLLAEDGYAVRTARSGTAGLACALHFHPDVVLCDFRLPDMDGLQVLRSLRATGVEVFIVVVTAGCGGGVEERAIRQEANLFLDKPVDLPRLREVLQAVHPTEGTPGPALGALN